MILCMTLAKGGEVLLHGLIDQDVAVGQEQDAFLGFWPSTAAR